MKVQNESIHVSMYHQYRNYIFRIINNCVASKYDK